jgi:hypothetical protein
MDKLKGKRAVKKFIMTVMMMAAACFAEVTGEAVEAAKNDINALEALLGQTQSADRIDVIHNHMILTVPRSNAVAYAKTLGASARIQSRASVIGAMTSQERTRAAFAHFKVYGDTFNNTIRFVDVEYLTTAEAVEFYEKVLKDVPLTDNTKDYLGRIKGELLKLKDI